MSPFAQRRNPSRGAALKIKHKQQENYSHEEHETVNLEDTRGFPNASKNDFWEQEKLIIGNFRESVEGLELQMASPF